MREMAWGRLWATSAALLVLILPFASCAGSEPKPSAINVLVEEDQYSDVMQAHIGRYDPEKIRHIGVGRWTPGAADRVLSTDSFAIQLEPGRSITFLKREMRELYGSHYVAGTFRWEDETQVRRPESRRVSLTVRGDSIRSLLLIADTAQALPDVIADYTQADGTFLIVQNNLDHPVAARIQEMKDSVRQAAP